MPAALTLGDLKASICAIMEHFCPARDFRIQFGIPKQTKRAFFAARSARRRQITCTAIQLKGAGAPREQTVTLNSKMKTNSGRLTLFGMPIRRRTARPRTTARSRPQDAGASSARLMIVRVNWAARSRKGLTAGVVMLSA
jgi:hypothetical protein